MHKYGQRKFWEHEQGLLLKASLFSVLAIMPLLGLARLSSTGKQS